MAPPRRPEIVIGLDVGKSSHRACVVMRDGEVRRATRCHHEPHPGPSASPSSAHHATQAKPKIHSRPNQKRGAPAPADTPHYSEATIRLDAKRTSHWARVANRINEALLNASIVNGGRLRRLLQYYKLSISHRKRHRSNDIPALPFSRYQALQTD